MLRGDGRSFSAGLDRAMFTPEGVPGAPGIVALTEMSQSDATARIQAWQRAFDWVSRPSIVSIAAVRGHAIGGGFQLALGADIRIVADDASFVMAEPKLGIVPDLGGTKRLVDLVGYSRAAEICLTARPVGADEALRIGLVTRVTEPEELLGGALTMARSIIEAPQAALETAKRYLIGSASATFEDAFAVEHDQVFDEFLLGRPGPL